MLGAIGGILYCNHVIASSKQKSNKEEKIAMWIVYLNLFWAYLKIGLFGFGGGYAMLSLIQHEAVEVVHYGESQPWLTPTEFTDIVAISQMTPGPIGINSATYVGYVAAGNSIWGSIIATFAVCLPSFILVLLVSRFILKHKDNITIKAYFPDFVLWLSV